MKKILYIYHVSTIGGGSYCLLNILKAVDRTKYQPIVVLREEGPLCAEIRRLNIDVYSISTIRTVPYNKNLCKLSSIRSIYNLNKSLKTFKTLLKEINPDLVYVNTMMMYPYLREAKRLGFKTLIHIREHWPEKEHLWQRNRAIKQIRQYADQIVAINRYSASMIDTNSIKCTIVYDWIDMEKRYKRMPLNDIIGEDCSNLKVFLYTGGLQGIKGIIEILNVFKNCVKNSDYRLLLMGVKTNTTSKSYIGLFKNIFKIFGYKTYSDKVFELIKSDKRIICMDNTYYIKDVMDQSYAMVSYFTIPHANLALAEGIIEGIPSIAACTDESLEYSCEGKLSMLYKINNIQEFAYAWNHIEENYQNLKNSISENNKFIKSKFSPKSNMQILDSVYSKILEQ